MDKARKWTDKRLAAMENRIKRIYAIANGDVEKKFLEWAEKYKKLDEEKRKKVEYALKMGSEDAEKLLADWKRWRRTQVFIGQNWRNTLDELTARYLNANEIAAAYVNGEVPPIAVRNYNAFEEQANAAAKEYGINEYSFNLVDENTIKKLATDNETLLPYKVIDGKKDVRWNSKTINAQILQGILQGESIGDIAKRLENVTVMNRDSAIRNARTAVTGAECAGRQLSYINAEKNGMIIEREWIASPGSRTRDWHADLDGVTRGVNEPFENIVRLSKVKRIPDKIMYPGDPHAHPANVYNCRCSIAAKVVGFEKLQVEKAVGEKQAEQHIMQAKTKAEAEMIAKQFGVDADYSNYDISVANAVNRTMQRTIDEFGPHALDALKSIGTDTKGKSRAGGFDEFSGKLSLSGTKGKDALFKMGEKTRKANERYQRMGMRYFSADDDMSTIHHEFGHIIHVSVGGSTTSTAATALDKEIIAFMRDKNTKVVSELSYYASINHNELISECVAQYMAGNPSEIALGVVEILKKYGLRK